MIKDNLQKEQELLDSLPESQKRDVLSIVENMEKQQEMLKKGEKVLPKRKHKSFLKKKSKQQKLSRKNNR